MKQDRAQKARCVEMPYGTETVSLLVPDGAHVLRPAARPPLEDLGAALEHALDQPVGRPPFEESLREARRITVIVPDRTRPAPTAAVLRVLLSRLERAGLGQAGVTVLVAGGDHPRHSRAELESLVGPLPGGDVAVLEHRADEPATHVTLGRTRRGTPVTVNRHVVETDGVIVTGVVSHHYFAGYGGGPKGVFPGAAGRDAIRANHGLVLGDDGDKDPRCRSGRLDGNPVHEDLCEAVSMVDPAFLVNVVLDGRMRPLGVVAGHWKEAHREGCDFLHRASAAGEADPFDLLAVSSGGHPLDIDLVQSHKAQEACAPLVRDGGTMLHLAACPEGYGDPFLQQQLEAGSQQAVLEELRKVFQVKAHTALCMLRKASRMRLHMVTELEPTGPLLKAGMAIEAEAAKAWERLVAEAGPAARIGLVPSGSWISVP